MNLVGNYKWDDHLKLVPETWSTNFKFDCPKVFSSFPVLKDFISLSYVAYKDQDKIAEQADSSSFRFGFRKCKYLFSKLIKTTGSQHPCIPKPFLKSSTHFSSQSLCSHGFEFLVEANNSSQLNGYYGVAYINKKYRQIIVSHRGTVFSNPGALLTDMMSICSKSYTPQVSSAMTFASLIVEFAKNNECEVFFTGHSLGAWLSQITCFSIKYLEVVVDKGYSKCFLRKDPPDKWDDFHPYTVVFDSPGAFEFLQKIKDDLFPRNDPLSQEVNVCCLPIEVFQFFPNIVNARNIQVGSVYLVDLEKLSVKYSYALYSVKVGTKELLRGTTALPNETHRLKPIVKFLTNNDAKEESVLRSEVTDWRIDKWEDFLHKWNRSGRSKPITPSRIPSYFLTKKELELLQTVKHKLSNHRTGCYEGVFYEDETIAASIVSILQKTCEYGENGWLDWGDEWDRRDIIAHIRHFYKAVTNGLIWWNPVKPQLPLNYIPRMIQSGNNEVYSLDELINGETLILLVGSPGMGKSTGLTKLESELRQTLDDSARIIIRVNLNKIQNFLHKKKQIDFNFIKNIITNLMEIDFSTLPNAPLYTLLDGLDEVCPVYKEKMQQILQVLLSTEADTGSHIPIAKIFLTTRPHLQAFVEKSFPTESYSFVPLTVDEQEKLLRKELNIEENLTFLNMKRIIDLLPETLKELMPNPLMISLIGDTLREMYTKTKDDSTSISDPQSDFDYCTSDDDYFDYIQQKFLTEDFNISSLYYRFIVKKHTLYVTEKEEYDLARQSSKRQIKQTLSNNLPYYSFIALEELLTPESITTLLEIEQHNELIKVVVGLIEKPNSEKTDELLSYGLVNSDGFSSITFKHRSFAEYFCALLLTNSKAPHQLKNALFAYLYRFGENVEVFLYAMLGKSYEKLAADYSTRDDGAVITKGWAKFVPSRTPLSVYRGRSPEMLDRIFKYTFDYASCSKVVELLVKDSYTDYLFFHWLKTEEVEWVRENIFHMNSSVINEGMNEVVVALTLARQVPAADISKFLNFDEIVQAISKCPQAFQIATRWKYQRSTGKLFFSNVKSRIEQFITNPLVIENMLMDFSGNCESLFVEILKDYDLVCWFAQTLSKDQLQYLITNPNSRVTDIGGKQMEGVKRAWGIEFLPEKVLNFQCKYSEPMQDLVLKFHRCNEYASEIFWTTVMEETIANPVDAIQLLRSENKDTHVLRNLEWSVKRYLDANNLEKETSDSDSASKYYPEVFKQLVKEAYGNGNDDDDDNDGFCWDLDFNNLDFFHLPHLILYLGKNICGTDIKIKIPIFDTQTFDFALKGLVLSQSVYDAPENAAFTSFYDIICSSLKSVSIRSDFKPLVDLFLETSREELREITLEALKHARDLIVPEIPMWEILVKLLVRKIDANPRFYLKSLETNGDGMWIKLIKGILEFSPVHRISYVFRCLSGVMPEKVLVAILEDLGKVVPVFRAIKRYVINNNYMLNDKDTMGPIVGILKFFVRKVNRQYLKNWVKKNLSQILLLVPLELLAALEVLMDERKDDEECKADILFIEQLIKDRMTSKLTLEWIAEMACGLGYRREGDWERLLLFLEYQPQPINNIPTSFFEPSNDHVYTDELAPLLRVWVRFFGRNETKLTTEARLYSNQNKLKEASDFWEFARSKVTDGELLHVAICLGSIVGVKKIAWPGSLKWENSKGKTASEVATEIWGEENEITIYLKERERCTRIFT